MVRLLDLPLDSLLAQIEDHHLPLRLPFRESPATAGGAAGGHGQCGIQRDGAELAAHIGAAEVGAPRCQHRQGLAVG